MEKNINTIQEIMNRKIGIVGIGQMGGALLLAFKAYLKEFNINDIFYLCDPIKEKRSQYSKLGFMNIWENEEVIFSKCKIIFICVKPDTIEELINKNKKLIKKDTLLISICAGISISYIEKLLCKNEIPRIIRIMANHLCLINESATVYSTNTVCDDLDDQILNCLLSNVGLIKKVNEEQMNVYTALSGSGPAFVYYFLESLIDGALKNGMNVESAREYAIQVVYAAAKYMKDSKDKNPNTVKYVVATPKGTTIAGLTELDKHKFKYAVIQAITAATNRSSAIEIDKLKKFTNPNY